MLPPGRVLLYDFPSSSCPFRVRIALRLKSIAYETVTVDLNSGKQHDPAYQRLSPTALVPTLVVDGFALNESLAIIEYLDEICPLPQLLPSGARERARVRRIAQTIASGIQPLHNERTEHRLMELAGATSAQVLAWCRHWVSVGMVALESLLKNDPRTGRFCHGDQVTLADIVLVPALETARRRFDLDLAQTCPTLCRIGEACLALPAFRAAHPQATAFVG